MDTLTLLLLGTVFVGVTSVVIVIYGIWNAGKFAEKRTVKKRLLFMSAGGKHGQAKLAQFRNQALADGGIFEQFVMKIPRVSSLDRMLIKSSLPMTATSFVFACLALGAAGLFIGLRFLPQVSAAIALAFILMLLPLLLLRVQVQAYYDKFQEQLPDALDLLARALRSGHALTSGLEMISEEMQDPMRAEFNATVDEIKLGLTVQEAFDNLCARVPSTDLRFFTIAVTVQRETGGNLAEVLDNISRLIRERVQFQRQLKALTAEGRLSMWILLCLPILMFIYIYVVNYEYISMLWTNPYGLFMIAAAIIMMIVGGIIIKRIVTIEL